MPELSRFYGIIIAIFYDEHNPPHFHARYNEFRASIDISTFAVIDGSLPPKALGLVNEWASIHQAELMINWELASKGIPLNKIEPLYGDDMVDVINARYIKDYLIEVEFSDSKKGIIDFVEYKKRTGLFSDLANLDFFRSFEINDELGTICWPNGLDIAPESLYSQIV